MGHIYSRVIFTEIHRVGAFCHPLMRGQQERTGSRLTDVSIDYVSIEYVSIEDRIRPVIRCGDPQLLPVLRQHRHWFAALPYTAIRGRLLFVHAGVRPGVPLGEQQQDLIWIRQPFLRRRHGLPCTVVHGHTITRNHQIDRCEHRINLDTGAFRSGVLSSLQLDPLNPASPPPHCPGFPASCSDRTAAPPG